MTVFNKNIETIRILSLILSSLVIGIEVSLELKNFNGYVVTVLVTLISFLILFNITKLLNKIGLKEEYWSFTILTIIISMSIYNMTYFIKYLKKKE